MDLDLERIGGAVRGTVDRAVKLGLEPLRVARHLGEEAVSLFAKPQDCLARMNPDEPIDVTLRSFDYYVADADTRLLGEQKLCEMAIDIMKGNPDSPPEEDVRKLQKISTVLNSVPGFSVQNINLPPEDAVVMGVCLYAFADD